MTVVRTVVYYMVLLCNLTMSSSVHLIKHAATSNGGVPALVAVEAVSSNALSKAFWVQSSLFVKSFAQIWVAVAYSSNS